MHNPQILPTTLCLKSNIIVNITILRFLLWGINHILFQFINKSKSRLN